MAPALTHELAELADEFGDALPQAAMTRASVALAQMRRLRTWVSSRRSTTPNAPLKADRQEASVPLRADGSPVWAFRSPGLRIAAPACLPEAFHLSGVCRTGTPRSQLRDSSGFAPDSLGTRRKLNASQGAVRVLCGQQPQKVRSPPREGRIQRLAASGPESWIGGLQS